MCFLANFGSNMAEMPVFLNTSPVNTVKVFCVGHQADRVDLLSL